MSKQEGFRPTDARPHLIPAMYYWFLENHPVVYLSVLTSFTGMDPRQVAVFQGSLKTASVPAVRQDGSTYAIMRQDVLILDIGPEATRAVQFHQERIDIQMRVGGKAVSMSVPYTAVVAMYVPVTEKIGQLQIQIPFPEDELLSNGVTGIGNEAANSPIAPARQMVAEAAGAETAPVDDQRPDKLSLDLSLKPTTKPRATHLTRVK